MASPRTMYTGSISLGLLNIPITVAKAIGDKKVDGLVQVCHHAKDGETEEIYRVDKSERCPGCNGRPAYKARAALIGENRYHVFSSAEWDSIEKTTESPVLQVLDVQKLSKLPTIYAMGTYFVRHNQKAKVSADAFAHLVTALHKLQVGIVTKWGTGSSEKLCILSAESGVLLLRIIPFITEVRVASKSERAHWSVEIKDNYLDKMCELLRETQNKEGFRYTDYTDEAHILRSNAVNAVLDGQEPEQNGEPELSGGDMFADLERSIEAAKQKVPA